MDAHHAGAIHVYFLISGLDWHVVLCLKQLSRFVCKWPFVQCTIAWFQAATYLCSLHVCLVKTHGLDHCHHSCFILVANHLKYLSWQSLDLEIVLFVWWRVWFLIWAVGVPQPESLTIMVYHDSQLFIQASNRMGYAWGSLFWELVEGMFSYWWILLGEPSAVWFLTSIFHSTYSHWQACLLNRRVTNTYFFPFWQSAGYDKIDQSSQ